MTSRNILDITNRNDFRKWLVNNSAIEKECWIAVDEALCFGWIDSTVRNMIIL